MPGRHGIPGYYGEERPVALTEPPRLPERNPDAQRHPAQQYWAPEQTHLGRYRFRPLSEREKHRLYSTGPAYANPGPRDFRPESYARALPDPAYRAPGRSTPRWNEQQAGGYSYRPSDPNPAQNRRWRSGSDPATRRDGRTRLGPESWSSSEYRWTAEPPSWQSPAERMLPAAGMGLHPSLTSLY